ncbi:phage portal protein [Devosia sp. A449]
MAFWDRWFGDARSPAASPRVEPRAMSDGGVVINTPAQLDEYLSGGAESISGERVTPNTAMKIAAVYACVRIIAGAVATLPLHIKRRVDDRTREDASDAELWTVIRRRPNKWQKPNQFRRMMQAHVLLRGNAYAMIVRTAVKKEVQALIPLHPDRVLPRQRPDMLMEYVWTRPDGRQVVLQQDQVFHLFGLSLDGITGVTPITYARETMGLSLSMERHGAKTYKNGAVVGHVLSHPQKLGSDGIINLKSSLESYRSGGENEGGDLILEEGMKVEKLGMSAVDVQWVESRKLSRTDIFMFFGLPPHMAGDTEKSTSWGTGIESQQQGFLAFTLEDHLVMWEEGITVDLTDDGSGLYAKFNRNALVRADLKSRTDHYVKMLQWGVYNPDKVLELEDENPRDDGRGGIYYDPPNTAGGQDKSEQETGDEPPQTA